MARVSSVFKNIARQQKRKRTRQGNGRGTKWGNKPQGNAASKKQLQRYKKKSRGQGKN